MTCAQLELPLPPPGGNNVTMTNVDAGDGISVAKTSMGVNVVNCKAKTVLVNANIDVRNSLVH